MSLNKERLMSLMASRRNKDALEAIEVLKGLGLLTNEILKNANLEQADLEKANLEFVNLQGARLALANLRDTNLHNANLQDADLDLADLTGADLRYADLQRAWMMGTDFANTALDFADMRDTELFGPVNFSGANMVGINLQGAQMSEVVLIMARLSEANLYEVKFLSQVELMQADSMHLATLPNGSRYDGRYRLTGDIEQAASLDLDLSDHGNMASYYGVEIETYLNGQQWADNNLGKK